MNLADLLFGAYRRDVLGLLLLHPEESFHVRAIARLTGRPANTLYRELATLASAGLLERSEQGNQVHYRANRDNPIYDELRGILRKTSGLADVLREALAPLADRIAVSFVYGSMASGEENARSDVDLMIVGDVTFAEAVKMLAPAEQVLRREVNAHVMGVPEFRKKAQDGFVARVMAGPKIILIGEIHDAGKPGRHRKAKAA